MRLLQFLSVFMIMLSTPFINAQQLPLQYSYTAQSPQFESSGNLISIHQEKDFAILQSHPENQTPDFIPLNHWDYNLNGNFSNNEFVVLRNVNDQSFMVKEQEIRSYEADITYSRIEGGQALYDVRYSNLRTNFTEWSEDTDMHGLKTNRTTLTVEIDATVTGAEGEIIHELTGTMEHDIRISPDIPYSPIAYNILINADAPVLFIEPQNYKITNERPWLSIGDAIYNKLQDELGNKGMIVEMNSKYRYQDADDSEYQSASGNLALKAVNNADPVALQPANYPVISEELFEEIYDASRYSQIKQSSTPTDGTLHLSLKNHGDFEGNAFFHNNEQFFALQTQTTNNAGDTLNFVMLKIAIVMPVSGLQTLSEAPISSIRNQMRQGPPDGYTQQFFISGTLKQNNELFYFLYPVKGSLTFDHVSVDVISGSFQFNMKAVTVKNTAVKEIMEKFSGNFEAVQLK